MAAVADPYEYTATGILGERRETMLENEILLRSPVGKSIKRGYNQYPGESFRYGRPNAVRDGGAPEALAGWGAGLAFPRKTECAQAERDFMALNKAAVQAGLTTAPENYQYRSTCDIRRSIKTDDSKKNATRRLPPTMVFGLSTRPSTPIHDLLEYKYQDRWLLDRRTAELAQRQHEHRQMLVPGQVNETRASRLRMHQVPVESAPLWKMPRFSKHANPHLQTFRTDKAKKSAFVHQTSDCISRKGTFGEGVYVQAKN